MILQSIRLHPFAGISDQTFAFNNGMNVIYGPNEFGKSTMVIALHHVLFSPTQLTQKKMDDLLKEIQPLNGSDTVCVTLQFSTDTDQYTLEKNWGATASSRLTKSDGSVLTEGNKIQEQILQMLPSNEAIVRQIMIANQSELAAAVKNMSTDAHNSLAEKLRGAILHGGGINGTLLQQTIENKVKEYFKRWDVVANEPEGGSGRGVNNPWQKDKGYILDAWYEWEKAKITEQETKNFEEESDRIQREINQLNESLNNIHSFLEKYRKSYDDTDRRMKLETEVIKFENALKEFSNDASTWPKKQAEKDAQEKIIKEHEKQLSQITDELKTAEKKKEAAGDINKLSNAKTIQQEIAETEKQLKEVPFVKKEDLDNIKKSEAIRVRCQSLIEGQKLLLNMRSEVDGSISITHSDNKSETISFNKGEVIEKNINGMIEWEWNGIHFKIQSANEDIETLKKNLEETEAAISKILNTYAQSTINDLAAIAEKHKQLTDLIEKKQSNLDTLLGKDTMQALAQRVAEANQLPDTRDYEYLKNIKEEKIHEIAELKAALHLLTEDLRILAEKHGSIENLDQRRLKGIAEVANKNKEMENLSKVPEEYDTSEAFSEDYKKHLQQKDDQTNKKHRLELDLSNLKQPQLSLQEASEVKIIAQNKYKQLLKEGQAYARIREVLSSMLAKADGNAFYPLHQRTENYLQQLSRGRFNQIPFAATQPQELTGPNIRIPVARLSKGTKDLLALAFRLAAADIYLESRHGFIVMDDPLVDMDQQRRIAAAEVLKNFAQHHQTIMLTCHEEHAKLLS